MFRAVSHGLVVAGIIALIGCKTATPQTTTDGKPGLLIGPEATGQAQPPAELPSKEAAKVCLRTAQEYEKNGKTEEAIALYEKARGTDPSTAKFASRHLAVLYDRMGDFSKAMDEYETLLKAQPKDSDLLNDLGYSYYSRGEWANAEASLAKAVQCDPNNKRAWVNLGLARGQLGKWDESLQAFGKAVRPAEAHSNLAFVLATQGKSAEAKAEYRQALAIDPNLRVAQMALARMERPKSDAAAKAEPFDPVAAAAKVPSIVEIEARMKQESASKTVELPVSEAKAVSDK